MSQERPSRRHFLKGAAGSLGGLWLFLNYPSFNAPNQTASGKPFRSIDKALNTQFQRRLDAKLIAKSPNPITPLETFLDLSLPFIHFSISNSHLAKEIEILKPPPTQFATKPWDAYFDRGEEYVPLLANNRQFTSFREDRMGALTEVFDRTVWAKYQENQEATAVLETFTEATPENVSHTVEILANSGCRIFIVGNETNIEGTPWFNKFDIEYNFCKVVWEKLVSLGIKDFKVGPAAPAFLGGAREYQIDRLKAFKYLAKGGAIPINFQPVHQYGPVNTIQDWIGRGSYLSELGSPAPEFYQEDLDDYIFAEGYPFQAILKAKALGADHITFHTLYDKEAPGHSLTSEERGILIPKSSYPAVSQAGEFLENVSQSNWQDYSDFEAISGTLKNHLYFQGLWSSRDDKEIGLPQIKGRDDIFVLNAYGEIVPESKRNLPPKLRSYLGGPIRILISQNPI